MLSQVNVALNPSNGKVVANESEQSSAGHIFAIGDILDGKPELTPVAIQVEFIDTLVQRETDKINQKISINNSPARKNAYLMVIWDNLCESDITIK
jgi:pyruvate/2-oxoglutarate dehydrogenase complex dihydrolipoamide dehydrogenase (E3) component